MADEELTRPPRGPLAAPGSRSSPPGRALRRRTGTTAPDDRGRDRDLLAAALRVVVAPPTGSKLTDGSDASDWRAPSRVGGPAQWRNGPRTDPRPRRPPQVRDARTDEWKRATLLPEARPVTRPGLTAGHLVRLCKPAGARMNSGPRDDRRHHRERRGFDWSAAAVVFPVPDGSLHTTIRAEWLEVLS